MPSSRASPGKSQKGTIWGYRARKQKSSTGIYSAPLPLLAPRLAPAAPRGRLQRAPGGEGTVLSVSASTGAALAAASYRGVSKAPAGRRVVPSGDTLPLRQDTSVPPRPVACSRKASFAPGSGFGADGFQLKKGSSGGLRLGHLLLLRARRPASPPKGAALLPPAPPRCPGDQEQVTPDKGGGPGLGIDLQSAIKNSLKRQKIIYSLICTK